MKIKSVTIEGMHNVTKPVTYEIKDFNYLIGKNGSGKSTVLQAIQLAILGYIPGTAKSNAAIFEHSNGMLMKVRIDFDDNTFIERSWVTNGKTINAEEKLPNGYDPKDVLGELELPIFNFSEFLGLTANKAKDWFMKFLPGVESNIDWNRELSESVKDLNIIDDHLIENTVKELSQISGDDAIEVIRKANEVLKADQSFAKGELQKIQGTIQSLIYYDDAACQDPDAELVQIKQELDKISESESRLHDHQAAVESNSRINSLLQTLPVVIGQSPEEDPNYQNLINQKEELLSTLNSLTVNPEYVVHPDTSEIDSEMKTAQDEYTRLSQIILENDKVIRGQGICPYTSSPCESIKTKIEDLTKEADEARNKMADLNTTIENLNAKKFAINEEFNKKESERHYKMRDCEMQIISIEEQKRDIEKNYQARESYKAQLVPVPEISADTKTLEEYKILKDQLIERSNKISANKQYNSLIETLTADKYRIENSIEAYKVWVKLTGENGLQTTLMEAPFTDFESDMNEYITKSFGDKTECKFNLSTKANSFSYGIVRDHKFIPYNLLSSGEKAMYAFALMRCIVSGYDSQLKLLIVDDMSDHLDQANLKSTFESLSSTSDIQIVLAGVNTIESMPGNIIEVH